MAAPATGDGAVDAERAGPLARLGERDIEHRQGGRREEGGEEALQCAGDDEHCEGLREAAEGRRDREAGQADDHDALASEDVAEAPAEEQKPAKRERVRGDDPLAIRVGDAKVGLRGGEGDVDDGHVEHDHELGEADGGQAPPAAGVRGGVHGGPFVSWGGGLTEGSLAIAETT